MSQENVEIVRSGTTSIVNLTVDFLAELLALDYVWDMSTFRGWAEQTDLRGHRGARLFIREWTAAFDDWADRGRGDPRRGR